MNNNDFVVFTDQFFRETRYADMGVQGGTPGSDGYWDNNDLVCFISYFFGCTPPNCSLDDPPNEPDWVASANWVRTGDTQHDRVTAALWHAFDRTQDTRVLVLLIDATFAP